MLDPSAAAAYAAGMSWTWKPNGLAAGYLIAVCLWSVPACRAERVRFIVHVPADTPADASVYIAGSLPSLGRWQPAGLKLSRQADGTHAVEVALESGRSIEFKVTRGSWQTVEKYADGTDRENRTAKISADTRRIEITVERWGSDKPPAAPKNTVVGTLQLHDINSQALHQARTIRVWLPPSYDTDAGARFDVLYMHDGQNCFDRATSAFGNEWEIDETLTRLIAEKRIRPIIVVAIDNGLANRINELTYVADEKLGGGKAAAYRDFLLNEVKPWVERTYRVNMGAAHTFLGGSSLGGLVSLEIARRQRNMFGGVLAMSPALWWANESLTRDIERDAGGLRDTRVWLDMGTQEGGNDEAAQPTSAQKTTSPDEPANSEIPTNRLVAAAQRLDAALTQQDVAHRLAIDADHPHHNEPAWAARFPEAIVYLLNQQP